jgi:hypothetical protein
MEKGHDGPEDLGSRLQMNREIVFKRQVKSLSMTPSPKKEGVIVGMERSLPGLPADV